MPVGDIDVAIGRDDDAVGPSSMFIVAGIPGLPIVISTLPSGLNLITTSPLPFLPRSSPTQTLPSLST